MSLDALRWALSVRAPHSRAKFILVAMADLVRKGERKFFASVGTLGAVTQMDPKTVRAAIELLAQAGLIRRTTERRGIGGAPVFELLLDERTTTETGTPSGDESSTETGTPSALASLEALPVSVPLSEGDGGRSTTSFPAKVSLFDGEALPVSVPKPGVTQKRRTGKREGGARAYAPVDLAEFDLAEHAGLVSDWEALRASKKGCGPISASVLRLTAGEAQRAGLSIVEAIEAAILFDWKNFNAAWWRERQEKAAARGDNVAANAEAKRILFGNPAPLTFKEIDALNAKLEAGKWARAAVEPLTEREVRHADANGLHVPDRMRPGAGQAFEPEPDSYVINARQVLSPEQAEAADLKRKEVMAKMAVLRRST